MKKTAIIGLALLLSACASQTYIQDVTSESHKEDYKQDVVSQPIMASENAVIEKDIKPTIVKVPVKPEEKKVVKLAPKKEEVKPVKVITTTKEQSVAQQFGYTIQVAAVATQAKVTQFASKLPLNSQPIWEHYKVVDNTKWYSILYGDYATVAEAQQAISTLPTQFQKLKPFVKSIDSIKKSEYPTLDKLN